MPRQARCLAPKGIRHCQRGQTSTGLTLRTRASTGQCGGFPKILDSTPAWKPRSYCIRSGTEAPPETSGGLSTLWEGRPAGLPPCRPSPESPPPHCRTPAVPGFNSASGCARPSTSGMGRPRLSSKHFLSVYFEPRSLLVLEMPRAYCRHTSSTGILSSKTKEHSL